MTTVEQEGTTENPLTEGLERLPVHPTTLTIFGGTGDLTLRKLLPALYHRFLDGQIPEDSRIIAVARSDLSVDAYRGRAKKALRQYVEADNLKNDAEAGFYAMLQYARLDAAAPEQDWSGLQALLSPDRVRVFYLATSPDLFGPICDALARNGLNENDARVVLTVSDTGQGIVPAFLPYVFDMFRRAEDSPASSRRGLGLGLSIARSCVEAHGGTLALSNAPTGGLLATITLPA